MMAVYEEALRNGVVRHAAKDLLVRTIRREFPEGWSSGGNVGAGVKLGSWRYEIKKYVRDAKMGDYASRIIRQLTIDNPPPEGWMAQSQNDSFIDDLFNLYWAVGPSEEKATA